MARVDAILARQYDVTSDDLIDCCFAYWYDDDVAPVRAARMAVAESMG